jgi:hypothetical protein
MLFNWQAWTKSVIPPKDGGLDAIILYSKNPITAVSELFSAPSNADGFKLWPNHIGSYTTPDTRKWWSAMQVAFSLLYFSFFSK